MIQYMVIWGGKKQQQRGLTTLKSHISQTR